MPYRRACTKHARPRYLYRCTSAYQTSLHSSYWQQTARALLLFYRLSTAHGATQRRCAYSATALHQSIYNMYYTPAVYALQRVPRKAGRHMPKYRAVLRIYREQALSTAIVLVRRVLRHISLHYIPQLLLFMLVVLPQTTLTNHFVDDVPARLHHHKMFPRLQ